MGRRNLLLLVLLLEEHVPVPDPALERGHQVGISKEMIEALTDDTAGRAEPSGLRGATDELLERAERSLWRPQLNAGTFAPTAPATGTTTRIRMGKNTKRIFTGTAGVYYVMYALAERGFHASATIGNAPNIDILVSSEDGDRVLAIQVKTTEHALRHRGRGADKKPHHLEFPLGHHSARINQERVLFAFVDLDRWSAPRAVATYLVPSSKVFQFCESWVDRAAMVRFHPTLEWIAPYREAWHHVTRIVGEPPAREPAHPLEPLEWPKSSSELRFADLDEIDSRASDRTEVAAGEGWVAYTVTFDGQPAVLVDSGTLADFLPPEERTDAELVSVRVFSSPDQRDAYVKTLRS